MRPDADRSAGTRASRRASPIRSLSCAVLVCGLWHAAAAQAPPPVAGDFVALGLIKPLPAPVAAAVDAVRAEALAAHIAMLASPAFEGRGLGTRGLEATAEYLAASLALAGIPPLAGPRSGAPASYFQAVPIREIRNPAGELIADLWQGDVTASRTFRQGVDIVFPESGPEELSAPAAFAGYGIRETTPPRDDYRALDVRDKLVVILAGLPAGAEWQTPVLQSRYDGDGRRRFAAKAAHALAAGARGVIAIETGDFMQALSERQKNAGTPIFLPYGGDATWPPGVVRVSEAAGDALLAVAGLTTAKAASAESRDLRGLTVTLRATGEQRLIHGRNVLGILRGSDPALSDEAVVLGAHMDHLGRRGETIYFGADDNASGTASLIEIAKAFAASQARPKRTLIFAFWTGEEEGHFGSDHYAGHPLWPLARTAAYVNLDMVGHPWKPEEIRQLVRDAGLPDADRFLRSTPADDFLEVGLAQWAPELAPLLVRAAQGTGVALHVDRVEGSDGGSDYRAFARRKVPFLRFFGNYFDGYHEPTDTADRLDGTQVRKMARLALAAAWLIADR